MRNSNGNKKKGTTPPGEGFKKEKRLPQSDRGKPETERKQKKRGRPKGIATQRRFKGMNHQSSKDNFWGSWGMGGGETADYLGTAPWDSSSRCFIMFLKLNSREIKKGQGVKTNKRQSWGGKRLGVGGGQNGGLGGEGFYDGENPGPTKGPCA